MRTRSRRGGFLHHVKRVYERLASDWTNIRRASKFARPKRMTRRSSVARTEVRVSKLVLVVADGAMLVQKHGAYAALPRKYDVLKIGTANYNLRSDITGINVLGQTLAAEITALSPSVVICGGRGAQFAMPSILKKWQGSFLDFTAASLNSNVKIGAHCFPFYVTFGNEQSQTTTYTHDRIQALSNAGVKGFLLHFPNATESSYDRTLLLKSAVPICDEKMNRERAVPLLKLLKPVQAFWFERSSAELIMLSLML